MSVKSRWPRFGSGRFSPSVWRLEKTRSLPGLNSACIKSRHCRDQTVTWDTWNTPWDIAACICMLFWSLLCRGSHDALCCKVMLLDDRTLEFHSQYGRHHRLRVPKCQTPRYLSMILYACVGATIVMRSILTMKFHDLLCRCRREKQVDAALAMTASHAISLSADLRLPCTGTPLMSSENKAM